VSSDPDRSPHVAAVVLNWNGRDDTLACLESLGGSDWPNLTTIVVDNGSEEEIEPAVAGRFPDAVLVRNSSNLGFPAGMNTGMRRALELDADYVLLLNNDTVVDRAMVRKLVETAAQQPDAGIVSPLEFLSDEPDVVSSFGLRCNPRRAYQGPPLGQGERDRGQFRGVREIDSSAGTAMLVPIPVVREVGLLDEDLFFYMDDIDWSLRMRKAGRRIYAALEARIWHGVATTSGGADSPRVTYYHTRNTFVVCARHAPMRGPRAALRHGEILVANLLHALRCRRRLANVAAVFAGWRDYLRGRLGARAGEGPSVAVRRRTRGDRLR
jgi:GT2 family glycosyltransferase